MRYHKIRGVDVSVCTAEQKIAYNLASGLYDLFTEDFKRAAAISTICVYDVEEQALEWMFNYYRENYKPGKVDEDALFCALRAGFRDYIKNPFIATSYEQIGAAFPAHYLNAAKVAA